LLCFFFCRFGVQMINFVLGADSFHLELSRNEETFSTWRRFRFIYKSVVPSRFQTVIYPSDGQSFFIALCRLFSFRIILLSSLSLVKPKYLLFPSNENILRLLSNSGTSYCNHVFNISFSLRLFDPLNKADSGLFFCD